MISRRARYLFGLFGIAILFFGSIWWHHRRVQRAYASAILLKDIALVDLVERTSRLIDEGRPDTARSILKIYVKSAIESSEDARTYRASLPGLVVPNLSEGLQRAAERAAKEGDAALAIRINGLRSYLDHQDRESWLDKWEL